MAGVQVVGQGFGRAGERLPAVGLAPGGKAIPGAAVLLPGIRGQGFEGDGNATLVLGGDCIPVRSPGSGRRAVAPAPWGLQLDENQRAKRDESGKLKSDDPTHGCFERRHARLERRHALVELLNDALETGKAIAEIGGFSGGCCGLHGTSPFGWRCVLLSLTP